jgi:dihydrofolate reductase
MLATIAALGRNRVIGSGGTLPWKLPGDLRHFREQTTGSTVIMGRTTYDSIGKPLPNRENWVLTRQPDWQPAGVTVFRDAEELLHRAATLATGWVIGGEQIYRLLLPRCQRQVLTWVDASPDGDAFYPEFDTHDWTVVLDLPGAEGEQYPYRFVTYERKP